jgi:uncharacterized membrane protein YjdF
MNWMAVSGIIILVALGIRHLLQERIDLVLQTGISLVIMLLFFVFRRRLHLDIFSYFFIVLTAALNSSGLYGTSLLGAGFDSYMHFLAGFTVAIIISGFFNENLARAKRFFLAVIAALGIGAGVEIAEGLDSLVVPGMEMLRTDEFLDCISDMICNGLGGITAGFVVLFLKK